MHMKEDYCIPKGKSEHWNTHFQLIIAIEFPRLIELRPRVHTDTATMTYNGYNRSILSFFVL
jgi:hypothetical protein